jgi:hypothetical protein
MNASPHGKTIDIIIAEPEIWDSPDQSDRRDLSSQRDWSDKGIQNSAVLSSLYGMRYLKFKILSLL